MKIIEALDITPTMFKNAREKYESLAEFLAGQGFDVAIYPQGSFAIGTVVRPIIKSKDAAYDLDFIYQIRLTKDSTSPRALRDEVERALSSSEKYSDRLEIFDECFKINYADVGDIAFSIDIVPAAEETEEVKSTLRGMSLIPDLTDDSIAIPKCHDDEYSWLTNNPKGYKNWFDMVNKPFAEYSRYEQRKMLYEQNNIYASIEDVPMELERSAVQKTIQLLKYHRDVYYSKIPTGEEIKPISAIISTAVATVAQTQPSNMSTFELLACVLQRLIDNGTYTSKGSDLHTSYSEPLITLNDDGEWVFSNPANPLDNLVNTWNENDKCASMFFSWAKQAYSDIILSIELPDREFRAAIAGAFGNSHVTNVWGTKYDETAPKVIPKESRAKPWREM